ncbi:MAG: endonuclease III [Alphaproteobacteria bacterium]|nr:endonuclease III [Alphaproteobacteria bacterium]MDA7988817.1 endonuclease III [Alphaproteobacteria bacterium]
MFAALAAADPEPRGELNYTNTYTLLVAVVLSAQATDKGVNKATEGLFARVSSPAEMLELGEEGLIAHIRTIGLYRSKARNVMGLSRLLIERHGGEVPRGTAELEALPGVGRKTASVVRNVAFGEETVAVDTHVFRVCNRTGLARGGNVRAVEDLLAERVPAGYRRGAHHWLILHGRYVCRARRPLCGECVIRRWCLYDAKEN